MTRNAGQEFQSIGSLALKVASSLKPSNSAPNKTPRNLSTTFDKSPARTGCLSTGTPGIEHGVATRPSGPPSVYETDLQMAASLQPRVQAWLRANEWRVWNDNFDLVGLSYSALPTKVSEQGRAMLLDALAVLDNALVEAPADVVKMVLARLVISTKSRAENGDDLKFRLAVYADELRYPPDVVVEACEKWARTEKWFPSVAELIERCENLVRWRRVTRDTLARMAA